MHIYIYKEKMRYICRERKIKTGSYLKTKAFGQSLVDCLDLTHNRTWLLINLLKIQKNKNNLLFLLFKEHLVLTGRLFESGA